MHDSIKKLLNDNQITCFGYSAVSSPFAGLDTAITIVVPLSNPVIDQIDTAPTHTYFSHYRSVNAFIDNIEERLVLFLMNNGYEAAAVPASQSVNGYSGIFSHKMAAVKAGLGYIGKSALFVSDKFGPRVRLGTVFTNAPLPVSQCEQVDKCGSCNVCRDKCPAMAISGKAFCEGMNREDIFDAVACSNYMKKQFQHIGRGAVCGICIKHCPKGRSSANE